MSSDGTDEDVLDSPPKRQPTRTAAVRQRSRMGRIARGLASDDDTNTRPRTRRTRAHSSGDDSASDVDRPPVRRASVLKSPRKSAALGLRNLRRAMASESDDSESVDLTRPFDLGGRSETRARRAAAWQEYLPSAWLTASAPVQSPYVPQMDGLMMEVD